MKRVRPWELVDVSGWFGSFMEVDNDGRDYEAVYWLKLPIYGWEMDMLHRRYGWAQRMLMYFARNEGMRWTWYHL